MIQHKWFRIEQGNDGAILSCTEVEARGIKGGTVRFYSAVDASAACSMAKEWYERRLESLRKSNLVHRGKLMAAGKCQSCKTEPARPDRIQCQKCANRQAETARDRRRRVASGETLNLSRNPGGPEAMMENYLKNEERIRSAAGGSNAYRFWLILKKFDAMGPVGFREWLVSKIPNYAQLMANSIMDPKTWHPPMAAQEETSQAAE